MPTYTFCCTQGASSETVQRECQGREQAIQYARRYLELTLDEAAPGAAAASASVGEARGAGLTLWLGSWDWSPAGGWTWTSLD